jgi:hypothetical protein
VLARVPCGPQTCEGCCQEGNCLEPSTSACGVDGAECVDCSGRDDVDSCGPNGGCICSGEGAPCPEGFVCLGGECVDCIARCCPSCAGKCAGADDGCGGVCPEGHCDGCCTDAHDCMPLREQNEVACGPSGSRCEACDAYETCGDGVTMNVCVCTPDCTGKCGGASDGCAGTCDTPCPTYRWLEGPWSGCSAGCGGGAMTRSVACYRDDGALVDESFCASTAKPPLSVECNTQPCSTYGWFEGNWSGCSASCGGGTMTRTVDCRRNDGAVVDEAYCAGVAKPPVSSPCNTQACPTYAWITGDWGECSRICDGGWMSRTVQCRRGDGAIVADSYCAGVAKPAPSQQCNTHPCFRANITGHRVAACETAGWIGPYYGCDCSVVGVTQEAHWSSAPDGSYCATGLWPHWITTYVCSAAEGVCP